MMKNRQPDGCREVLKLKIAIVTGASSGMGREFALQIPQLYKNLHELWVVARRTDRLKNLQEQVKIPVRIFDGDMQRDYIFEKLQRELDRRQADVRMLVNAAGYGKIGNVSDIDLKEQCGMVDLNCTALTRMTGICLPYLSKGSRIVNLASAASFCAQPGFCVYAASKAYVLRFSQGLAAELKKRGILVTAVCPGPVRTEFFDRAGALAASEKEALCAEPEAVVTQALTDSVRGRCVSVYGAAMKGSRILSKILPDRLLVWGMMKINHADI